MPALSPRLDERPGRPHATITVRAMSDHPGRGGLSFGCGQLGSACAGASSCVASATASHLPGGSEPRHCGCPWPRSLGPTGAGSCTRAESETIAAGLLLVGARGSGKTTVTMAAVRSGFGFVADDYLLLEAGVPCEGGIALRDGVCPRARRVTAPSTSSTSQALAPARVARRRCRCVPSCSRGSSAVGPPGVRRAPAAALRAWAPTTVFKMSHDRGRRGASARGGGPSGAVL